MATELLDDLGKVLLVKPSPNRVLVTEKLSSLPMEGAFHSERGFIYYRTVDGRILIGGGRHWGHDKDWVYSSDGKQALSIMVWDNQLIDFISDRLGYKPTIEHRWMGWIGVGKKRMPLIGSASDRIHYAVRLGGMGVAIGMEVGESLVEHGLGSKM
jgi:gamma-glutamylputrescine oxidase